MKFVKIGISASSVKVVWPKFVYTCAKRSADVSDSVMPNSISVVINADENVGSLDFEKQRVSFWNSINSILDQFSF